MTTVFVMKSVVALFVLGLGALVLWANNTYEKDNESTK